jgi:hypothetical protein
MSENRSGGGLGAQLLIALAVALVAGALLGVYLIGSETLRTLGLILVVAIALAVVIAASALPIRAWRRRDFTGDHYHTDGTRTIVKEVRVLDGRVAEGPKLYQLPAQPQGAAFPDLLRAAYAAGATALPARSSSRPEPEPDYAEIDLPELNMADGWDGDIKS